MKSIFLLLFSASATFAQVVPGRYVLELAGDPAAVPRHNRARAPAPASRRRHGRPAHCRAAIAGVRAHRGRGPRRNRHREPGHGIQRTDREHSRRARGGIAANSGRGETARRAPRAAYAESRAAAAQGARRVEPVAARPERRGRGDQDRHDRYRRRRQQPGIQRPAAAGRWLSQGAVCERSRASPMPR